MRSLRGTVLLVAGLLAGACSDSSDEGRSRSTQRGDPGAGGPGSDNGVIIDLGPGNEGPEGCRNLQCQQRTCSGGTTTTLTGRVFDPSGRVPIYNVTVYVPNDPLEPLLAGANCVPCEALIQSPVAATITDTHGRFRLEDVPVGENIPVVIQVGKWRRQITVPNVPECTETALPESETRLPRNQAEGDIPLIAIATGGADSLECFLLNMGIDPVEFTPWGGPGRVHLYQGSGFVVPLLGISFNDGATLPGGAPRAEELWNSIERLIHYDMVILSCEGGENLENKPPHARDAIFQYLNSGGRVFASHFHYVWFSHGPPPLPQTVEWGGLGGATSPPYSIDQTFPKGQDFAQWLVNVGASSVLGQMDNLDDVRNNVRTINQATSLRWVYKEAGGSYSTKYYSFNTPIGVPPEDQCGRGVHTDIHVAAEDASGGVFPNNCRSGELSAQEKALLFLLMDLSSCVRDETRPPEPPPIVR